MFKRLVVEDDKDLNDAVCSFLNQSGYEVTGCLEAQPGARDSTSIFIAACPTTIRREDLPCLPTNPLYPHRAPSYISVTRCSATSTPSCGLTTHHLTFHL